MEVYLVDALSFHANPEAAIATSIRKLDATA